MMNHPKHKNIILVGPMGAGKSSVGKYLAQKLGMDFYDTDEEIENRTGVEIGWIFDLEGEEGFRKRESDVIADLMAHSPVVIATGGGSLIEEKNRDRLARHGYVIYLEVSLRYQHTRTLNESRRPLLRVKNRQEVLEKLQQERTPHYEDLADFRVTTDKRSIAAVADDIIQWLETKASYKK